MKVMPLASVTGTYQLATVSAKTKIPLHNNTELRRIDEAIGCLINKRCAPVIAQINKMPIKPLASIETPSANANNSQYPTRARPDEWKAR